jgi:hypothetical protein
MMTQLLWWHFLNSRYVYFKRTYLACSHTLHLTNTLFIACWHLKWKHYILNAAFVSPSVQEYSHKLCSLACPTSKYSTVLDLAKEGKESSSYDSVSRNSLYNIYKCLQCEMLHCLAEKRNRFTDNRTGFQQTVLECVAHHFKFMVWYKRMGPVTLAVLTAQQIKQANSYIM